MDIPVKYTFSRGSGKFYNLIKQFFMIKYFWDLYCDEKYYKGTDSILYFSYVPHNDLKICPKVSTHNKQRFTYYYDPISHNIIFEEFPIPDWAKEYDPSLSGKLNESI